MKKSLYSIWLLSHLVNDSISLLSNQMLLTNHLEFCHSFINWHMCSKDAGISRYKMSLTKLSNRHQVYANYFPFLTIICHRRACFMRNQAKITRYFVCHTFTNFTLLYLSCHKSLASLLSSLLSTSSCYTNE